MKDREQASKENLRDYIKKDTKTKNAHSKNQIVQTIEEGAINESVFETKKRGY